MLSQKIVNNLKTSSWIRAMFEEGEKLRRIYGEDKVYDFSLGNPDPEPPAVVKETLMSLITSGKPGMHRYMSNAGYPDVRGKIAQSIGKETGLALTNEHVIMTCGAAGGLNVVLKTILNPDEEVIVFAPYFVEYNSYADNHGGKTVVVPPDKSTFEPDIEALKSSVTPRTKAVIVNSPNNPTGVIYKKETLDKIAKVLEAKEQEYGTTIFIISDEPYNKLVYDGVQVPSILNAYKNSISVNSYSKSLALPGERIGYIAVNPQIVDLELLMSGLVYCNRILGYVNAPALFQKVIAESLDAPIYTEGYRKKRDMLYNHLISLGFSCVKPQGAFYLFPKAFIDDDIEFARRAVKYNILLVPGTGFGCPGYVRLAYCISEKTIENSLPAFEEFVKEFK